ncbi:hypothetical protein GGI21_000672 [Coemansia aciculifera]|uniref:Uncharacterized protein n=1 Tax=Coemansia aciculifera TaxID=417176 RepID=A0ACC1LZY2_9FUNG|nr:hypothetical protein IWW38_004042 [Coemansia aciculifera]KAJ2910630.1 hypothetical protein GGI21_000672 [Coemansia aciculifera]
MLSRIVLPLSRLAISRTRFSVTRSFSVSALAYKTTKSVTKTATKPAADKKPKRAAVKAKKPAKAKKPVKAKTSAKPKRAAVKKAKATPKKELLDKVLNGKRAIVSPPKAAPNAYSLYVRDAWKAAKESPAPHGESQAAVFASVSRSSADAWRALGDSAKQQYAKQHDAAQAQHSQAVREWWAGVDLKQVGLENQRRRRHNRRLAQGVIKGSRLALLKDPRAPKRPVSAYILFSKEHMTGVSGKISDLSKARAAQWKALSDAAKAPYVAAAQAQASAYKAAVQKYAQLK